MKKSTPAFRPVEMELPGLATADMLPVDIEIDDPRRILRKASLPKRQGEVIAKLAVSRFFVRGEDDVDALAAAMDKAPELIAVGVVDAVGSPVGIMLRRELFDLLGKPYGREFYKKKPVSAVMKATRSFHDDESIFGVADILKAEVRMLDDTYYLLIDGQGCFSGVFSTKNILIYLSDTTARDIALARRLQSAIVRDMYEFDDPRCSILCSSKMAKEVGGDFYIVKRLNNDRLLMGICDVSGKGIAASLITAVLGGIFDTYTAARSIQTFLRSLNRYLFDTFRLEYFVTGIFIELDMSTGQAIICDMGHSYVLVQDESMLFRLGENTANPPLGIVQDLAPALSNYRFSRGGLVLLFTDGVVEQTDRQGQEYSPSRLSSLLKCHPTKSPAELQGILSTDFDSFRGSQPQSDDVTFMILKYA